VLEAADAVARQLGLKYISTDAIVIALVDKAKHPDSVVDFLAKCAAPCARPASRGAAVSRRQLRLEHAGRAPVPAHNVAGLLRAAGAEGRACGAQAGRG